MPTGGAGRRAAYHRRVSRRSACGVAGVAVLLLIGLLFVVPVPFSVLSPGPSCNTVGAGARDCPSTSKPGIDAPLITVPAAYDHPSTSRLIFLTVSELNGEPTAGQALVDAVLPGHAIVPRELLHPPGQSEHATQQQDTKDMVRAADESVVVAEQALGLDRAQVETVQAGPATGVLRVGDLLLSVDGRPVSSAAAFIAAVGGTSTTTPYEIGIERNGTPHTVTLHKAIIAGKAVFGIEVADAPSVPIEVTLDPTVIGGPSAGLMFALGIYDRLTPGNLAGSTVVAGTGQLDLQHLGQVDAIGGIQQKLYAARHHDHATVFLAPADNCADTRGAVPAGLRVVPVASFTAALAVLAQVRAGDLSALPRC